MPMKGINGVSSSSQRFGKDDIKRIGGSVLLYDGACLFVQLLIGGVKRDFIVLRYKPQQITGAGGLVPVRSNACSELVLILRLA